MNALNIQDEITAMLRSRYTLLWIVSREEQRAETGIITAAGEAGYSTEIWDCANGHQDTTGYQYDGGLSDPRRMMTYIQGAPGRVVYIMRDLHKWMDPMVLRSTRSLARKLQSYPRDDAKTIIILSPSSEVPEELAGHAVVLDYPLPDREEVSNILSDVLSALDPEQAEKAAANGDRESAIGILRSDWIRLQTISNGKK